MKKKNIATLLIFSSAMVVSSIASSSFVFNNTIKNTFKSENNIGQEPVARIVGHDESYTSIEKALDVAVSGDIVYVIPPLKANYNDQTNPNNPDKATYKINRNCTIKAGVTLFIPTDQNSVNSVYDGASMDSFIENMKRCKRDQGKNGYNQHANANSNRFLRVTVEIGQDVKLTNNGRIVISGYLSGGLEQASGLVGQTSHSYSRIVMHDNAQIVQDNNDATLYCFGYIEESKLNNNSKVSVYKGKLFTPIIINDFHGIPYSYAMTVDAIDEQGCSPFNDFGFVNITAQVNVKYSGKVIGIVNVKVVYNLDALQININENYMTEISIVGNTSDCLLMFNNETYSSLIFKYEPTTDKMNLNLVGGFNLNNFNLDINISALSVPLSTKNAYLPISNRYNIRLTKVSEQSIANFDFSKQKLKLLPGSEMIVDDGVNLNGSEIIVYTAFFDGINGAAQGIVANSGRSVTYPLEDGAILKVLGTSTLNFSKIAGYIYCDNKDNIKCNDNMIVSKEPRNTVDNTSSLRKPWKIGDFLEIHEILNIVPLSYFDKTKIFVGVNIFTSLKNFLPKVNLIFDGNTDNYETVEEFQKIIFLENNSTYKVEFINNIFKVFSCGQLYKKDSEINISPSGNYLNLIGSNLYISNDADGVNEFNVQNIQIIGDSHDLFLDTIMQLRGEIVDIDKVYNKEYKWSSLNPEIATVDNTGLVTSKGIGTTTIMLECDGHIAEYEINVIERQEEIVPIEKIEIRSTDGHAQESELADGDYEFEVICTPTEADILNICWTIDNNGHPDRQAFILNGERVEEVNDATTVQVNLNGGAFAYNRDPVTLTCQVVDKTGITASTTFKFYNKNSICFASDTLIHTLNGMVKVSELNEDSQILTFNHFNGKFEYKKIAFLVNHGLGDYKILRLKFEKLNSIDIINFHSFFDYDLMKYVNINIDNVNDYIGHRFVFFGTKKHCFYKLIDSEIVSRKTSSYSFITEENLNFYANGVLNCTPDVLLNLNVFDFDKEIQYNKEEVNTALAKYKLCSLNDFCVMYGDDVDAKYYYKFNLKMLNIYLAKGVYSNISVNGMILYLNQLIEKGEALIY